MGFLSNAGRFQPRGMYFVVAGVVIPGATRHEFSLTFIRTGGRIPRRAVRTAPANALLGPHGGDIDGGIREREVTRSA